MFFITNKYLFYKSQIMRWIEKGKMKLQKNKKNLN
jgi:hypothetical protein